MSLAPLLKSGPLQRYGSSRRQSPIESYVLGVSDLAHDTWGTDVSAELSVVVAEVVAEVHRERLDRNRSGFQLRSTSNASTGAILAGCR
jgi:hypothetical protein